MRRGRGDLTEYRGNDGGMTRDIGWNAPSNHGRSVAPQSNGKDDFPKTFELRQRYARLPCNRASLRRERQRTQIGVR
jgi:hypothetical protein